MRTIHDDRRPGVGHNEPRGLVTVDPLDGPIRVVADISVLGEADAGWDSGCQRVEEAGAEALDGAGMGMKRERGKNM